MKVGSLFSGIGGFDAGLEAADMECIWQVEQDKDCNKVLRRHWPGARRYADVKEVGKANLTPVDLICGGFPCQDLSVAGKRAGLDGERSGLWFEFHRIIRELRPQWVLIENVPGLLSSDSGRDFATILSGLGELGYFTAWRVLDSQWFGVAQRRRRVFIVASLRDGRCAEVLFEPSCGCGDTPTRREAGEEVAGTIAGGSCDSRRGYRNDLDTQGAFVPCIKGAAIGRKPEAGPQYGEILEDGACYTLQTNEVHAVAYGGNRTSGPIDKAARIMSHGSGRYNPHEETFIVGPIAPNSGPKVHDAGNFHCNQAVDAGHIIPVALGFKSGQSVQARSLGIEKELSPSLEGGGGGNNKPCVAIAQNQRGEVRKMDVMSSLNIGGGKPGEGYPCVAITSKGNGECWESDVHTSLSASGGGQAGQGYPAVRQNMLVRRLTPTECERLQAFPDGWTSWGLDEQSKRVEISDSARYRMLGNAVTVSVINWIGRRIIECLKNQSP